MLYILIVTCRVVAYVMCGTLASDAVRHLTCAPESGPLIGSPFRTIRPGLEMQSGREVSRACALDENGRICNMGTKCGLCEML